MISFTTAQLYAAISAIIWPFFRVLALVATEPILGNRSVPARVKIGISLLIALIIAPSVGPIPDVPPVSLAGLLLLMQQVLIGIAMGFTIRIIFTAVEMAGHLAGLQMGLGFASFFDPQTSAQVPIVAQFLGLITVLVYLAINGHFMLLTGLVESFRTLPISTQPFSATGWYHLVSWGGHIFHAGLILSLPVIAALLITNVSIAIMTRAAPQLNVFAVGFPLTLAVGMFALYLSLPYFIPSLGKLTQVGVDNMMNIVRHLNPAKP